MSAHPEPVLRFAPSPNGFLHLGHGYSALFTARIAARLGAKMLVRIEDIDTGRARPEYIDAIFEDLRWLGLDWPEPVRRQSAHFNAYREAAARLQARGLLYRCGCTRTQLVAGAGRWRDPDGGPRYPGTCRRRDPNRAHPPDTPFALRLDMKKAIALAQKMARHNEMAAPLAWNELDGKNLTPVRQLADAGAWGDVVLVRKDVPTSYHLSVVVDDAAQAITHVTRGRDLFAATAIHRVLQIVLGLAEPDYFHHPLILDEDLNKLAKSKGSTPLRDLRADGWTPDRVRAELGVRSWR